jgi:hypothetical protein
MSFAKSSSSMCLGACCERLTTSEVAVRLQFLGMPGRRTEWSCEVSAEGVRTVLRG